MCCSKNKKNKSLITAYQILGKEDLKIGNEINLTFNDNKDRRIIKIDDSRHIYENEEDDIVIIEIKDNDKLNKKKFLDINQNTNHDENEIYNKKNNNKSFYILHYPSGNLSSLTIGVIKEINYNKINHCISTEDGSSRAPILNLDNCKVGIHQGYDEKKKKIME